MTVNYLDLMIVFTTLLLSVLCIAGGTTLRLFYHREISLEYLGWGTLPCCNLELLQLCRRTVPDSRNDGLSGILYNPVSAASVFPVSECTAEKRYQKLYRLAGLAVLLEAVIFTVLQLCGLRSAQENVSLMLLLFCVYLILMMATVLIDLYHRQIETIFWPHSEWHLSGLYALHGSSPISCKTGSCGTTRCCRSD